MKQKIKMLLGAVIIVATIVAFWHYLATHPQVLRQLGDSNPWLLIALIALYIIWFLTLVIILRVSLRLFGITMSRQENLLLNAYSSLLNFFGPGQSGPIFRGLYLKRLHGLRLKDYTFTALLYYGAYAIISAFFMFVGTRPWWQTMALVMAATGASTAVIRWYAKRKSITGHAGFTPLNLGLIFAATGAQLITQLAIYYLELRNVQPDVTLAQALAYTGTANFALFASLTPGAIGIREALLVFSQGVHGITDSVIVAANVVDRAIYLVFLGLLFIFTLSLHAKDKLGVAKLRKEAADEQTLPASDRPSAP